MTKNYLPFTILVLILAAVGVLLFYPTGRPRAEMEAFAKCLAEKGAVMYGAASCSWCQKEKAAFGSAFRHVPYVECPAEPKKCIAAGIEGTPTWIFNNPSAGAGQTVRLVGYQGLEKLSQASGCKLNNE